MYVCKHTYTHIYLSTSIYRHITIYYYFMYIVTIGTIIRQSDGII